MNIQVRRVIEVGQNLKREIRRLKMQAKGLQLFEIDAQWLWNLFKCESASRNKVGGQKLMAGVKNSKLGFGQLKIRTRGPDMS